MGPFFAFLYQILYVHVTCDGWRDRDLSLRPTQHGPYRIHCCLWPGFIWLTLFSFSSILRDKPTVILHITTTACIVVYNCACICISVQYLEVLAS